MADRRMLSRTILDSDKFLDMPLTTQALYIHLIMNADDDGFLNNSQKIIRMIGAAKKDFELLISSNFLIDFQNGICLIKHWKLHNYIRSDRYKPTVYQDEMSKITIAENKVYEIVDNNEPIDNNSENSIYECENVFKDIGTNKHANYGIIDGKFRSEEIELNDGKILGIPVGSSLETQNRLDEVSIDKDSINKNNKYDCSSDNKCIENNSIDKLEVKGKNIDKNEVEEKNIDEIDFCEVDIIKKWNSLGVSNISCIKNNRQKMLQLVIKEYGRESVMNTIDNIKKSSFLKGKNDRGWVITFDWFIKLDNFIKVFEGKYDDNKILRIESKTDRSSNKLSFNNFPQREYDYDELEKKLLGWN